MIVHRLEGSDYISDWDEQYLEKAGAEEVWYTYHYGNWEGRGQMIIRKDGKWWLHDMGHCSCYGPCDEITLRDNAAFDSIKSMYQILSDEYKKQVAPVIDMILLGE